MIRLFGAVLVAAGTAWLGVRASAALRDRVRALEDMAEGLALLEQELELDAPALPQLMERLAARVQGPARLLFQDCRRALDHLEEESFSMAWRRLTANREELGEDGQQALFPLGDTLGRCGCQEQRKAVDCVRHRLKELAEQAEEVHRRQGKVYQILGVSGGAFLIILLV
ncbi:MAG: stage III sporulation protein AB [Lawsonibacter sp.]